MPAKSKYVKLEDCRKCEFHKGENQASYVKCGRVDGRIAVAMIAPSNYNPGIKNGALAVHCHNVPLDKELAEKIKNLKVKK